MAQFFPSGTTCRFERGRGKLYSCEDAVKIVSMHSSKGLKFGLVLIPNLGEMPKKSEYEADEARLLYVAMTRRLSGW